MVPAVGIQSGKGLNIDTACIMEVIAGFLIILSIYYILPEMAWHLLCIRWGYMRMEVYQ